MRKLKKCILIATIITLLTMGNVMASGFNLSFYQALEGQEINMVDSKGNVIESVTIDAMGRASFVKPMAEDYSLEMDLNKPIDLETLNRGQSSGIPINTVIIIVLIVGAVTCLVTAQYLKRTIEKKYEFLLVYEHNSLLDDDDD